MYTLKLSTYFLKWNHILKTYWSTLLCYTSGEGDGIPLQCSCLENPMDGGAWWAAVHGVAQSRTRLKRLSSSSSSSAELRMLLSRTSPGSPLVRTPCFHSRDSGLIPSSHSELGSWMWCGTATKTKQNKTIGPERWVINWLKKNTSHIWEPST